MKPETTTQLIDLLKKDKLIFKQDFTSEDFTTELILTLQKKIKKEHQIIRWILGVTLLLVFLTFLYLELTLNRSTKFAEHIVRFWYILLPMLTINIFLSKYSWNAKRNLLILDLLEKEMTTETE
ncbi:MAG TPA: hypothetical protein VJ896_04155 [Bacteroidales bacterium]|nr:hypothetical protein [Bacteroidales bacterium]